MNRRNPVHFDGTIIFAVWLAFQLGCTASEARGQGTDPRVRITVTCADGTLSIGSGAMVKWNDEPQVALTASHIFDDGVKSISVCVAERGCFPAELIGRDEENDLAAVRLAGLKDYLVYPIAESDPPSGSVVELHGYGNTQTGTKKSFTGRVVGRGNFGNEPGDSLLLITVPVREGDSGGPVTVESGIVGVISATEIAGGGGGASKLVTYSSDVKWATVAPTCSRIRSFFGRLFSPNTARSSPGRCDGPPPEFVREPYADENGILPKWRDRYPGAVLPGPVVIGPWAADAPDSEDLVPVPPIISEPEPKPSSSCVGIDALRARLDAIDAKMELFTEGFVLQREMAGNMVGLSGRVSGLEDLPGPPREELKARIEALEQAPVPQGPTLDELSATILAALKADTAFHATIARLVKVEPIAIDPVDLAAKIQPHLDPIHVKVEVLDKAPAKPQLEQDVYLGGTLPLRLFPVPPKPK